MDRVTPDDVRAAFAEAGFKDVGEELAASSAQAIALVPSDGDDAKLPIGTSKLGGMPDLPRGTKWPAHKGRPLAFLAQLNLADIPRVEGEPPRPTRGLLSFFYFYVDQAWGFDPADRGAAVVLYSPDVAGLVRTEVPSGTISEDDEEEDRPFSVRALDFVQVASYPGLPDSTFEREDGEELFELYHSVIKEGQGDPGSTRHQFLGLPLEIQGSMKIECQLASNGIYLGDGEIARKDHKRAAELLEHADDWTLLLQLDTDDSAGWMWGDCGMLYFWIRKQDLQAGDFSRTWFVLQCS